MALLENSDFFNFPEGFKPYDDEDVYEMSYVHSPSSLSSTSSKRETQQEMDQCLHCGRYVTFLISRTPCCSFECILGYHKHQPEIYDFCVNLIAKAYTGGGRIKPAPTKKPGMTTEEFWDFMLSRHYDSKSLRATELLREYESNQFKISSDVDPNKKHKV